MNYWIFKVNPKEFLVDQFLNSSESGIWWRINRFKDEIKIGDIVFLWRTGTPHGICSVLQIENGPSILPEEENRPSPYWVKPEYFVIESPFYADCRIIEHIRFFDSEEIKRIPGLEHFSFFKAFQQATNFSMTFQEGRILHEYINKAEGLNFKPGAASIPPRPQPAVRPVSKAVELELVPPIYSDYGLYECASCGKSVMGFDQGKHVKELHGGKGVEWKKIR